MLRVPPASLVPEGGFEERLNASDETGLVPNFNRATIRKPLRLFHHVLVGMTIQFDGLEDVLAVIDQKGSIAVPLAR